MLTDHGWIELKVQQKVIFFFLINFLAGASHLKDIFYRMGLSDKDIVALSGGHTLVFFHRPWIYM